MYRQAIIYNFKRSFLYFIIFADVSHFKNVKHLKVKKHD